jgi:hypothetical protein
VIAAGLSQRSYAMPEKASNLIGPVATIAQQKRSNWCWAAVITSVVAARVSPPVPTYTDQAEFAFQAYSVGFHPPSKDDCLSQDGSLCNYAMPPPRIAGSGVASPLSIAGIAATPPQGTNSSITDKEILDALSAGKAVCIVIAWGNNQWHFVAVVGAALVNGVQQYLVGDPIDGSGNWFDRAGLGAYHSHAGSNGTWGDTYVTI